MQHSDEWLKRIGKLVQPSQMIAAALISGVLMFAIVALFVRNGELKTAPGVLELVALFFAVCATGAGMFVGTMGDRAARQKIPLDEATNEDDWIKATSELAQAFQVRTIITYATTEGAAFFNLIVVFVHGDLLPLVVAAILVTLMIVRFPTRLKFVSWLENQVRTAKEEKAVGR